MRINNFSRKAATVMLAGTLAFGMAACSEDEGADVDTEMDEGEVADDAASEAEDMASDVESEMDEAGSEMDDAVSTEDDEG
jgi:hypothetical protein